MSARDLTCRVWSDAEWRAAADPWQRLLAASDNDPLFLSYDWQTLWWRHFGGREDHELRVLAVYRGGALIGLAPLYASPVSRRGIRALSLQLVGSTWRDARGLLSEYLDVIAARGERDAVMDCVLARILEPAAHWDELVIANTVAGDVWAGTLARAGGRTRRVDGSTTYQADLSAGFERYLAQLSDTARRSLWNLRSRLAKHGAVSLAAIDAGGIDAAFAELNDLHARRWGGALFGGARLSFHQEFAQRLAHRGELAMTRLAVAGRTVSMLYDVRIGARQYNIQMGFDPGFDRTLSLGLLHLGYAMESAASAGVREYDFLAGPGRSTDYKSRISQRTRPMECVQFLRRGWLPRLYRWHDAIRAVLR